KTLSAGVAQMEGMDLVWDFWLTTFYRVVFLAVVFGVLDRLMPCNSGMYWWKDVRGAVTDFIYWFALPLFLYNFRTLLVATGVDLLSGGSEPALLPVGGLRLWRQWRLIMRLRDVLLYGTHRRLHHSPWPWKFHAVHHS